MRRQSLLFIGFLAVACRNGGPHGVFIGGDTSYTNTTSGEQKVSLPDGSVVVLGDGTKILTAKGFGAENRELTLDGDGRFDVVKKAGLPMIVHTRNLKIEVLGTRFHVSAYSSKAGEQVDLLDGALRVSKTYHSDTDNEPEVLQSGEMVMINRDIDLMEKEKLTAAELDQLKGKW